jgi:hypothetical protein
LGVAFLQGGRQVQNTRARQKTWRELMAVGRTIAELWGEIQKLDPSRLMLLTSFALNEAARMIDDPEIDLVERRRALLLAQLCAHRVVFDLMGLTPSPDADTHAEVSRIFFP